MKRPEATNFHIRITKEEAEYLLKEWEFEYIMCAEYGQDNNDDPDAWTGLTVEDLDENGKLDDEWVTLEMWFIGSEEEIMVQIETWKEELNAFNTRRLLEKSKSEIAGFVSLLQDFEKGIRSDSQLVCDALNSGMLESGLELVEELNNLFIVTGKQIGRAHV